MFKKFEKLIFYIFIFCIPFQTRIILANWAPKRVGFNEWTSAFLHATDLLILVLLLLWLIRGVKRGADFKFSRADIFLGIFFLISALSVTQSSFKAISLYQLIKLAEFIGLYFYIKSNFGHIFSKDRLLEVLVLSGFLQALIAIAQYMNQSALGLKIFGESPITPGGYGVASFYVGDQVFLRAYGTMPHPNILAAFLLISICSFYFLYFNIWKEKFRLWLLPVYGLMLYALFLTYSRTVIFFALLAFVVVRLAAVIKYGKKAFSKKIVIIAISSLASILLFSYFNFPQIMSRMTISSDEEAVTLRLFYNKVASEATGDNLLLGEGIGTFVPNMMQVLSKIPTYFYQPVHNTYLLISAETGILGLGSFLVFLFLVIKNYIKKNSLKDLNKLGLLLVLLVFLAVGLFDHFPWTIQQGRILFFLALAFL